MRDIVREHNIPICKYICIFSLNVDLRATFDRKISVDQRYGFSQELVYVFLFNWDHWVHKVLLIFRTLCYCDLETVITFVKVGLSFFFLEMFNKILLFRGAL